MRLQWGSHDIYWGGKVVVWGSDRSLGDITHEVMGHWTITAEYADGTRLDKWTGAGDLPLNGVEYEGVGDVLSISGMVSTGTNEDARTVVTLNGIPDDARVLFLRDPGVCDITLQLIESRDGGNSWNVVPRTIQGRLSNPTLQGGRYQFTLATPISTVDRGRPRPWSDEAQRKLYSGDQGLEYLSVYEDGVEINWPPLQ